MLDLDRVLYTTFVNALVYKVTLCSELVSTSVLTETALNIILFEERVVHTRRECHT